VVGAGHNGLVAANLLVDRGWRVLVLEAQERPGGAVASVGDQPAPGFVTDLFSAFYPLAGVPGPIRSLGLEAYGLRWSHAPDVLAHVFPDGRTAVISRDVARTSSSVGTFAPEDGARWSSLAREWDRVGPPLLRTILGPFPPFRGGAALAAALQTSAVRFARLGLSSAWQWTQDEFEGEGARLLVAGNAAHADLPITAPGSALFGWLLAMLAQRHGFPVPEGGSGQLTSALVRRLESRGGTLVCGAPVTRVIIKEGRALGVATSSGDEHRARHVLADVDAPRLFRDLVGEELLPDGLAADLDRFTWDPSTLKVNWALSRPIPWTSPQVARAGTVHLDADLAGLADYTHALATQRTPERPFLLLGQMTTADPTRSPEGTESVWAYTHLPRRDWTTEEIDQQVGRIQAVVEAQAPGFADRVIGRSVQGPGQLAAADANLGLGSINGGTSQLFQQLVLRPTPSLGRAETFVDGLYLAGASAHPGGGVHGACGRNAARAAILRDRSIARPMSWALTASVRRLAR
jgi:phytoene dehydrogenase-like protein